MSFAELQGDVEMLCRNQTFKAGISLKDCRTGAACSVHGDHVFSSGSVRKIAILMSALKQVHDGKVSFDRKITIRKKFQQNRSGCIRHLKPGFTITFQDALTLMIIVSDNTCTGHVVDILKVPYINAYIKSVGMKKTRTLHGFPPRGKEDLKKYRDTTTPNDVAHLLDLILQGTTDASAAAKLGCSRSLCRLAIDILSKQMYATRLPLLLPDGTKVAHKTGSRKGVANDAGIVYHKGRPLFILTAFTLPNSKRTPSKAEENIFIGTVCRLCYDHFTKHGRPLSRQRTAK